MDTVKRKYGSLAKGFLIGSAAGALWGLLFAPKAGKELRKDIKDNTNDLLDDAKDYMQVQKGKTNIMLRRGRKKSKRLVNDTKKKVDTILKDAENLIEESKSKSSKVIESTKNIINDKSENLKNNLK